ncbi:MAG TPA: hypothetical protein VFR41_01475, partial [Acidimicrobiia bacterium]|nr:hypothetical protein [Acidimicrobiia bacterium]
MSVRSFDLARRRAVRIAVLVTTLVVVPITGTPAAHATIPDTCGVYLQGAIDPLGRALPDGIPTNLEVPSTSNHVYLAAGHVTLGQHLRTDELNVTPSGGNRKFYASVKIGGTTATGPVAPELARLINPTPLPTSAHTNVKIIWSNYQSRVVRWPTIQVSEGGAGLLHPTIYIAKGVVNATSGRD